MSERTVVVVGPSGRGEGQFALRAATLVAMGGLLLAARGGPGASSTGDLAPYQVRLAELAPGEQRIARELREGLTEAETVRAKEGRWPEVAALAADGVPPFAADPLAPELHWSLVSDGSTLNYLGLSDRGGPSYLLVVQEPEPGNGDPPGTPPDEVHHVLRDGTILHVYACVRDGAPPSASATSKPWLEGWKQIVADAPAKERP
ncbi:MAG: hypothetical protein JST54_00455 [Deltaproteobacteria bacterium]|nr:hypothetical protein [Deltaproteobacteria bacterium]